MLNTSQAVGCFHIPYTYDITLSRKVRPSLIHQLLGEKILCFDLLHGATPPPPPPIKIGTVSLLINVLMQSQI